MKEELTKLVIQTAKDLGEEAIDNCDDFSAGTRLFGDDGLLDSMGLVSLVIAVEQSIEDEYGQVVALADEKALSQSNSPYRTVATLVDYAHSQMPAGD
ncbi:MAG: acyl carrier protein [Pseudomonadota bacterium]